MSIPAPDTEKLPLVRAACAEKLRKLGKEGAAMDRWNLVVMMFIAMVVAAIIAAFLGANYNSTDLGSSERGWMRLAFWISFAATPGFLLATIVNAVRAIRVQSSATFAVACPSCAARRELSGVFAMRFNLTCPSCYAVVDGSADSHATRRHCDYCHLDWYGTPTGPCVGCRGTGPGGSCRFCKTPIYQNAIACLSCGAWLSEAESGFATGAGSYDPVRFSARLARAYALGLWSRVAPAAAELEALLGPVANPGALDAGTWGRIGSMLSEPKSLLPKLALAVEWARGPGGGMEPLPAEIAESLAKMDASIERCNTGGMKLNEELDAVRKATAALAVS